jgi:hypothetical protein
MMFLEVSQLIQTCTLLNHIATSNLVKSTPTTAVAIAGQCDVSLPRSCQPSSFSWSTRASGWIVSLEPTTVSTRSIEPNQPTYHSTLIVLTRPINHSTFDRVHRTVAYSVCMYCRCRSIHYFSSDTIIMWTTQQPKIALCGNSTLDLLPILTTVGYYLLALVEAGGIINQGSL